MLIDTPEYEKPASKHSSQVLENFGDLGEGPSYYGRSEKPAHEQRLSAFLRTESNNTSQSPHGSHSTHNTTSHSHSHSPHESPGSKRLSGGRARSIGPKSHYHEKLPRPSFMSTPDHGADSNSPAHAVTRADIRASAEKILYTFVLQGSEREIILPENILHRIIRNIEEEGRDDPEVFDDAKDYVFQAMERDAFPGFLQAKALGNLVPLSVLIRLTVALASLGGGLWGGYYMILTNTPRHIRCWVSTGTYLPPSLSKT